MIEIDRIENILQYNNSMRKSLLDKIFFMDKIDSDVFVDYGCADGSLLNFLHTLFPEHTYLGFDIDDSMIDLAKDKCTDDIILSSKWDEIDSKIKEFKASGKKVTLILSSIIHEVYSYGTGMDIKVFWDRVFNTDFDYIVIRDMMASKSVEKTTDMNDFIKILRTSNKQMLYEFETYWGTLESNKNLLHYLLKYRYTENWNREVKENYLPIFREELLSYIPPTYVVEMHEHYVLPFLKNKVFNDFGITLKDNTHIKLILKKAAN